MKHVLSLTLEQEFKLALSTKQSKSLSPEQLRTFLVELMRQNMIKDNIIKDLLRDIK